MKPRSLDVIPACLNPEDVHEDMRPGWGSEFGQEDTMDRPLWQWMVIGLLPVVWITLGWFIWRVSGPTVCLLWSDGSWSCLGG